MIKCWKKIGEKAKKMDVLAEQIEMWQDEEDLKKLEGEYCAIYWAESW